MVERKETEFSTVQAVDSEFKGSEWHLTAKGISRMYMVREKLSS